MPIFLPSKKSTHSLFVIVTAIMILTASIDSGGDKVSASTGLFWMMFTPVMGEH
jgi:hypothetical protein